MFKVTFALDEIVHILAGEVVVREEGPGPVRTLGPGDVAYFPMGLVTHWNVPRFVRKFFVVRVPGGHPYVARIRQRFDLWTPLRPTVLETPMVTIVGNLRGTAEMQGVGEVIVGPGTVTHGE
jgi:hypothetical protein